MFNVVCESFADWTFSIAEGSWPRLLEAGILGNLKIGILRPRIDLEQRLILAS